MLHRDVRTFIIVVRSVKANTKNISVVCGINHSFKCQNTISLKTGVSNKVHVMRRLHYVNVSARKSSV